MSILEREARRAGIEYELLFTFRRNMRPDEITRTNDMFRYDRRLEWNGILTRRKRIGCEIEISFESEMEQDYFTKTLNRLHLATHSTPAVKYDGSVYNYGCEIVSPPMPADKKGIETLVDMLREVFDIIYEHDLEVTTGKNVNAGLHIHIQRRYRKNNRTYEIIPEYVMLALMRLIPGLLKLTNRKDNGYTEYPMHILMQEGDVIDMLRDYMQRNRNCAVNGYNLRGTAGKTVELRIFEGTLDLYEIKARLQFADVLTELITEQFDSPSKIRKLNWSHIRKLAEQKKYAELVNTIKRKNIKEVNSLIATIPLFT